MKPINNYGLSDSLIDTVRKAVREALVGGQKKLDVDKDGKLEKTDFASLRAKKDAVDTKPKLKEDHPDEKEDKALIKKLIKKADVSDDEEDKALIKKTMKKEEEQMDEAAHVKTNKYSWGTMKTVHQGSSFSIPLHPEHHEAIAKLKDQQEHKFKDETGHHWTAKRQGDDVHFQGANGGNSTKVPHKAIAESKEDVEQMDEVKLADLPRRMVKGKSYGADYVDPEGADDADDKKKAEPKRKSGPQGTMKRRFIKDKSKLRMQYK